MDSARRLSLTTSNMLESRTGRLGFIGLVGLLYFLSALVSVAVHEVGGHALFAWLQGGDVYAIYLSPGSGYVSFYTGEGIGTPGLVAIYLAGIAMQMLVGLLLLFLALPRVRGFLAGLSVLTLASTMLVPSAEYLFTGAFYRGGDTWKVISLADMPPDIFIVTGLMLVGLFVLLISAEAVKFLGRYMELGDESRQGWMLVMFWLPALAISGIGPLLLPVLAPAESTGYGLAAASIFLMTMILAVYLVPQVTEPVRTEEFRLGLRHLGVMLLALLLASSVWIGVFGLSNEQAVGVLLHQPPVEVEPAYGDYTIGNAELFVYANGTLRVDIILRNRLESPSPLEERIYHTFDRRPYWESYITRTRYMLVAMFDLPADIAANLTFSTGLGTARAQGMEDPYGRMCTTYIDTGERTRQGGFWAFQPGMGLDEDEGMVVEFNDPWYNRGGYLDEVRITWDSNLTLVSYLASNPTDESIEFNRGSLLDNTIGWKNLNLESAPTHYRLVLASRE